MEASPETILVYTAREGRGVACTRSIPCNATIQTFRPKIRVIKLLPLNTGASSCLNTCQHCLHDNEGREFRDISYVTPEINVKDVVPELPIGCGHCKIYRYCNYGCYIRDWYETHRFECCAFESLQKPLGILGLDSSLRLVLRAFVCCELDPSLKQRVWLLSSHADTFKQQQSELTLWADTTARAIANAYSPIFSEKQFVTRFEEAKTLVAEGELHQYLFALACIVLINSNIFANHHSEDIGLQLDPEFSLINHSCVPNAMSVAVSRESFSLLAISNIKKGAQVTVNYCTTSAPRFIRQAFLLQKFLFDCQCRLCKQETDYFFSYNCRHCNLMISAPVWELFFTPMEPCIVACQSCKRNLRGLHNVKLLHQKVFALVIFELSSTLVKAEEDYANLDLSELVEQLKLPADQMLDLALSAYTEELRFNSSSYAFFKRLLRELDDTDDIAIPSYCFPVKIVVASLMEYELAMVSPTATAMQIYHNLQSAMRLCFEVDVPSVLSESKLPIASLMKSIVGQLIMSAQLAGQHDLAASPFGDHSDFVVTLLQSAYVIATEGATTYSCTPLLPSAELLRVVSHIASVCSRLDNPTLREWNARGSHLLARHERVAALCRLFEITSVSNYRVKSGRIYLQYANRNYSVLFE